MEEQVGASDRRISDLVVDMTPMREATEVADLFAALARSVLRTLGADACLVSVLEPKTGRLRDVAASVVPPAQMNTLAAEYSLDDFPATREVIRTRSHVEISVEEADSDAAERRFLDELGFKRLLMCGFSVGRAVEGVVEAYRLEDRPFRSDDHEQIGLMTSFAANNFSRIVLAERLQAHYTETIEALTSALEARDPYTQAHTGRIRDLSVAVALALKMPADERKAVHLGSLLHDVGKIGISDTILQKPGPLTPEEWEVMREHPAIGVRMLEGVVFLQPALPVIYHHHERWDGRGYPDGLRGEEIPLAARVVAVCDAYDAMTSDRPYRKALSQEEACRELIEQSGTQFDQKCARLLVGVVNQVGERDLEERFVRFAL